MAKSLDQLKKEVERLEKRNKTIAKIQLEKAKADKQQRDLEQKIKSLKSSGKTPSRLRKNLKVYGKKAQPLLRRMKRSLDAAAANY